MINESDKLFITVLLLQIKRNKCCDVDFSLHDKISYEILKSSNHFVPLIAVASKCNRQENEIDESNVSKEDMKDEYNETLQMLMMELCEKLVIQRDVKEWLLKRE